MKRIINERIIKFKIFFYSTGTFSNIGFIEDKVYWSALATGLANLIATIVLIRVVESVGRRPLVLYPLILIFIIMILLCVFTQINPSMFLNCLV